VHDEQHHIGENDGQDEADTGEAAKGEIAKSEQHGIGENDGQAEPDTGKGAKGKIGKSKTAMSTTKPGRWAVCACGRMGFSWASISNGACPSMTTTP
jgi:hypothetical protein